MPAFIQEFKSVDDIIYQYQAPADALNGATIYLAWYGYGDYEGSSLVVFEKDGKLYEVNGSHCSCYGLDGQWEPEETSWAALATRQISGYYDGSAEAQAELDSVVKQHTTSDYLYRG